MGNPVAARVLAKHERQAIKTGKNPWDFIYKKSKTTKQAKLLTLLVEFNDQANDDFSGWSHPKTINDVNDCVTEPPGTKLNGPLHNRIPDPALAAGGGKDNNSMWVPDFNTAFYNDMLYSSKGITKRVRTDLTDPRDGKKGIDISGYTMKNMYEEMSKGPTPSPVRRSAGSRSRTPRHGTARASAAPSRRTWPATPTTRAAPPSSPSTRSTPSRPRTRRSRGPTTTGKTSRTTTRR